MPCYQRGRAVISSCVWGVIDRQSVMVCRSDGCHFERELLFYCCSLKWCPVLGKIEVPWMLYPRAVMWGGAACCCCRLASPPHKTQDVRAGSIIHPPLLLPLLFLLHTGDGATVTCVSSNPSHNAVCTPQAGREGGYAVLKHFCSFTLSSNMCCAVLALFCLLQQVVDTEPPHLHRPAVFFFRSTGPACCRVWCSAAEMNLRAIRAFSRKVAGLILPGSFAAALKLSRTLFISKWAVVT